MSYWKKSKLSKRINNFAVYQLCAFVSIVNPVAVDVSLYKVLKEQFKGKII